MGRPEPTAARPGMPSAFMGARPHARLQRGRDEEGTVLVMCPPRHSAQPKSAGAYIRHKVSFGRTASGLYELKEQA